MYDCKVIVRVIVVFKEVTTIVKVGPDDVVRDAEVDQEDEEYKQEVLDVIESTE